MNEGREGEIKMINVNLILLFFLLFHETLSNDGDLFVRG